MGQRLKNPPRTSPVADYLTTFASVGARLDDETHELSIEGEPSYDEQVARVADQEFNRGVSFGRSEAESCWEDKLKYLNEELSNDRMTALKELVSSTNKMIEKRVEEVVSTVHEEVSAILEGIVIDAVRERAIKEIAVLVESELKHRLLDPIIIEAPAVMLEELDQCLGDGSRLITVKPVEYPDEIVVRSGENLFATRLEEWKAIFVTRRSMG